MNLVKPVVLAAVLTLFVAGVAFAGANVQEGKEIFQQKCKICHMDGGEGGKITPASKTSSQWRRFFKKNQHKSDPGIIDNLSENELKSLRLFLDSSAADANKAETCG